MGLFTVLAVCCVAVTAAARTNGPAGRIVGGAITTINKWPEMANVLYAANGINFYQTCGGTIVTTRSVLSAAHCVRTTNTTIPVNRVRVRVGSTYASSGGSVYNVASYIIHPSFNAWTMDSDLVILRVTPNFVLSNLIQPGSIASPTYNLADNQVVWATGWGRLSDNGPFSEELREVQIWTVNQTTCAQRYAVYGTNITANMLCTGWLDVGGRDTCQGDAGGPIFHNFIVVGVASFGRGCAQARYPGVSVRVSRFTSWIQANA